MPEIRRGEVKYVEQGRALFGRIFPPPDNDFDALCWDLRHLRTSQHDRGKARVYFTRHGSQTEPLPSRFANVLKAYLVLNRGSAATLIHRVQATRILWEAILQRCGTPDAFDWLQLTEDDLLRAEQMMLQAWNLVTTYKNCRRLEFMIRTLASAPGGGLVRPMDVSFTTPRLDDMERFTLDGQDERMRRLPPDEAIYAVGDVFAIHAKELPDRLIACVLAVMLATAFRIGEVLTLPLDCVCSEGTGDHRRWGVRYYKEKSRGGMKQLAVRWMTPKQAELAKTAIEEALGITNAARARARILEKAPDRVPLPGYRWNSLLGRKQVADLLGRTPQSVTAISPSRLPRSVVRTRAPGNVRYQYRAVDVSGFLSTLRARDLWMIDRRDGTKQKLSESLFVVFRNFTHKHRGTNPLLVESMTEQMINDFLGGRTEKGEAVVKSVFERFGLKDSNGAFFKMHTHQFRHWVTTKAAIAGVPDEVIARWQGREHIGELEAYKHLTPAERIATLKTALESGRTKGPVADFYFNLKDDVRDAFLEGQLQAVHVTPLGLCVHDFKVSPCPKLLNCVKDCDDYLFDTSNETHRQNLVQLRERTKLTLEQAEAQKAGGGIDLSESWVADAKATLAGVERILAAVPSRETAFVRPYDGRGSRFERTPKS